MWIISYLSSYRSLFLQQGVGLQVQMLVQLLLHKVVLQLQVVLWVVVVQMHMEHQLVVVQEPQQGALDPLEEEEV